MATSHSTLTGTDLHEPKGAAAATINQTYVSDGAGSGNWQNRFEMGFFDYNDLATQTTAISIPSTSTFVPLTNDEAGPYTNKAYKPSGVTDIWDSSTNRFDFSELSLGDTVDLRLSLTPIVATTNTEIEVDLELAEGSGSEYSIAVVNPINYKTTGTKVLMALTSIYMGDTNTLNNPAFFKMKADATCTVKVNGWYCKIIKA